MSENLKNKASIILNEFMPGENTASRVGNVLVDAVNEVDATYQLSREITENMTELLNESLDEINGETTIGETSAQKLRNILNSKAAIKEAIQSKGVDMLDSPLLSDYADRIGNIQNNTDNESDKEWSPNPTWWDIESIIQDTNNQEYTYKTIQLLLVSDVTTTFTGGVAYKTSDGQFYTSTEITHTWDTTQDKQCTQGERELYKTRWVITYHSSPNIEMNYFQRSCLYFIMDGVLPIIAKIGDSGTISSVTSFKMINGADFTYTTDFNCMFESCTSLKKIPLIDTSNGTDFSAMFAGCLSLTSIPLIDTSNGTLFTSMFISCFSLTSIPPLNTSNGIDFQLTFSSCFNLRTIPLLDTTNGTHFMEMFNGCISLKAIESDLDVSKSEPGSGSSFYSAFEACYLLENLRIAKLSDYLKLSDCKLLNHESLIYLINNLTNVSTPHTITLGETNLAKLSVAERQIATNKGWRLE